MSDYKTKLFTQSTINAVVLTGFLSFLMHPFVLFGYYFPDMGFLAWFFLVPLILGIHRYNLKNKIILCFLSGMIGHYGTFYWLMTAMQKYGGLNFFQAIAALTVMIMILSLVFALLLSFTCWINHLVKIPFFILLPVFMTTHDFILHFFLFNGFPWGIPPYSQGQWIQFLQWVDYTGIFGLSFFIYLINGLFADGLLLFVHRKQVDKMVSRFLVAFVLILLSLYGSFLSSENYEKTKVSKGSINVALIQGNIPQDIKWDPYKAQDNLNVYLKLTNTAVKDGADVVIWPETSYPYGFKQRKLKEERFLDKTHLSAPIFFGAVVTERRQGQRITYNSVIYADTDAKIASVYRKIHLVPFGEYVPFKEYLSFLSKLTQGVGEFYPGTDYILFDVKGFKFASLICFEDIFPTYARKMSLRDADVLVNVTNDAWYGDSSAQHQHLVFSQFRALENRRVLVRSTNTGMTAIINPRGEVTDSMEPFKAGFLMRNLKIDEAKSYYTEHGDTWVTVMAIFCGLIFLYTVVKCRLGPVKVEF